MCGFIASFGFEFKKDDFKDALEHLARRGPDSEGIWSDKDIFLGSRRLAIFDLNIRSNQPMISLCERYVIVFNGSIYNYKELRNYLISKNIRLKTQSDTEVLLELYSLEGNKMLNKLKGMFAFVIWDKKNKELFAARDPYGIKPLYIGLNDNGVILASQVKTIISTKFIDQEEDLYSQFSFYNFGFVIEPRTWFKNIKSLKPGCFIKFKDPSNIIEKSWYNFNKNWINADDSTFKKKKLLKEKIIKSINNSVERHLISDVPIGIFLSSGVDSSLLAGIASQKTKNNIKAITVSFEEFENSDYNEALKAKKIAKKFGLEHHIFKVTKEDFKKDLPDILKAMDQPTIDGINVWYASKAAAKLNLKVVFSGLGGDELFFGYNHFKTIPLLFKLNNYIKKIPILFKLYTLVLKIISKIRRDKRIKALTESKSILDLFILKRTIIPSSDIVKNKVILKEISKGFYEKTFNKHENHIFVNKKISLSNLESIYYLRNQLLRDSDWASMYHGVELRTPLVDITLLEDLSDVMLEYSNYSDKKVIKSSFSNILTRELNSKKKIGFQTPVKEWIKDISNNNFSKQNNYWYNYMELVSNSINKK